MNIVGIIAEYNPMHNGHIYHIKKAKELAQADYCIVIMSGSFTQQGNISILDKFTRAKLAIENGADLVIELPTIYSTASAESFAKGAVNILNSLGCVTHLAFGAETNDLNSLKEIAKICIDNESCIVSKTKESMKLGITSATARSFVLKDFMNENYYKMLNKPNNILGIEYLKTLYALNSQIEPVLVHRLTSSHSERKISNMSKYTSSTAIREYLAAASLSLDNCLERLKYFIPENTLNELKKNNFKTNKYLWRILRYEILKLGKDGLKNIADVSEGLENKLYESAISSCSYSEYIFKVKSKRYTLSRIKRICTYIMLGITKDLKEYLKDVNYCRVLKIHNNSLNLLSLLNKNASNPVITKLTERTISSFDENISKSISLDILSNNIVGNISDDYINNIIV